jgi:hypothetical protein
MSALDPMRSSPHSYGLFQEATKAELRINLKTAKALSVESRQLFRLPAFALFIHSSSFVNEFSERGKLVWNRDLTFD